MQSPKKKEVRANPTVLISPLRKQRKSRIQELEETSDDEVQLCRVRSAEGSPERPNTQRSQTPRMYHQSPQRLSCSSRIPSDASTEPLVPQTPNEGNNASTKRKAEEPADADVERARQKKASTPIDSAELTKALHISQDVASTASPQAKADYSSRIPSDASTELFVPQTPNEGNSLSTKRKAEEPADADVERAQQKKASTPVDSAELTKALRVSQGAASTESPQEKTEDKPTKDKETNTQPAPTEGKQAKKQPVAGTANKPQEGSMGPPNQQQPGSKRPSKEEGEARIAQEIDHLMKTVKCLPNYYKLVDKIGEGTFSTVYKAQDIRRDYYDNNEWVPQLLESAQNSFVSPSSSQRSTILEMESEAGTEQAESTTASSSSSPSSPKDLSEFVALKRVYDTSSPRRIANEIKILKKLKGSKCISPLITAFRQQDQVFVVMPYIQHDEFKPSFHKMELIDIKYYMKSLFTALQQLHRFKILHRDVKPSNFLYNIRKRAGYLIDFGLAESEDDVKLLEKYVEKAAKMSKFSVYPQAHNDNKSNSNSSNNANASKSGTTKMANTNSVLAALSNKTISAPTSASSSTSSNTPSTTAPASRNSNKETKGFWRNDPRLTIKANRAGTRGFRAPEILLRVTHQTCAIDIWAAGVILLCFLTNTYPFFLSNDEADALIELSHVYGTERMEECAKINSKRPLDNWIVQ
ncbi:unnamed protein product [Mucor fragilis]